MVFIQLNHVPVRVQLLKEKGGSGYWRMEVITTLYLVQLVSLPGSEPQFFLLISTCQRSLFPFRGRVVLGGKTVHLESIDATQSGSWAHDEPSLPKAMAYARRPSPIHTRASAHEVECWTSVLFPLFVL